MYRIGILITIFALSSHILLGQSENLFSYKNYKVTENQFLSDFYTLNNIDSDKDFDSFFNNYLNYHLKIIDATQNKKDTSELNKIELIRFEKQLVNQYLIDKKLEEKLLQEAYERCKIKIKVQHIQFNIHPMASRADTIHAYRKAIEIRKKLIAGENFNKIAKEISDDPSAIRNKGDLGYISVFQSPSYQFENYIYNNYQFRGISPPIKTDSAFHIIKIIDTKQADHKIKFAHVFVKKPSDTSKIAQTARNAKVQNLYNKIKNGADFHEIAEKYSEDKKAGINKAVLNFSFYEQLEPCLDSTINTLNINEISEPVKSSFGTHIIKLINKESFPEYEQLKPILKKQLLKSQRINLCINKSINSLKNELNYKEFGNLSLFHYAIDSLVFQENWKIKNPDRYDDNIFSIEDKIYIQLELAKFIEKTQRKSILLAMRSYIPYKYEQLVNHKIKIHSLNYFKANNVNFQKEITDYYNDLLLYQKIHNKINKKLLDNSVENYYNKNKKKYLDSARIVASIFEYNDTKIAKNLLKKVNDYDLKELSDTAIVLIINDNNKFYLIENKEYTIGDNALIDEIFEKIERKNKYAEFEFINFQNEKKLIFLRKYTKQKAFPLQEIEGIVLNDYRLHLENKWVKELQKKYPIKINKKIYTKVRKKIIK